MIISASSPPMFLALWAMIPTTGFQIVGVSFILCAYGSNGIIR